MNKMTRISIGKTPYDIEADAEKSLNEYLTALSKTLEADGSSETLADIELHITEILAEQKVQPGGVITTGDVAAIKEQLGDPRQFGDTRDVAANSTVRKPKWWLVVVVVAILAAGGASLIMWRDRLWPPHPTTVTETQNYDNKTTSLDATIESGNLEVRVSTDGKVSVQREIKWVGTKPTYGEQWSGEQLRITADCPDNQNNCSVDYIVYIPQNSTVQAQTQAGHITVTGLAGDVRLTTSAGNIDVAELTGNVWAQISDGHITGSRLTSKEITTQTHAGNIDLDSIVVPNLVVAKTASGNIGVAVPTTTAYAVRAVTSSGQREVLVPQNSSAAYRIDAEASVGNITITGR